MPRSNNHVFQIPQPTSSGDIMSNSAATNDESLDRQVKAVRVAFARHGHGFQYAVAKRCAGLFKEQKSCFHVDTTEFPVEVNGVDLHIDIVLRSGSGLIVIECKRVNSVLSTWCFARSVLSGRFNEPKAVRLERVLVDPSLDRPFVARDEQSSASISIMSDSRFGARRTRAMHRRPVEER